MLLSLLIGKDVLSISADVIADNQVLGKIDGICWQKGSPCLLQCGENTFSADRVKVKGDVVCDNLQTVAPLPTLKMGKCVYDTDGKLLGVVQDVELTATLKVKNVTLDNGAVVLQSKIIANNDIVTVRAARPKRVKKKVSTDEENTQQALLADESPAEQVSDVEQVDTAEQFDTTAQINADAHKVDTQKVAAVATSNTTQTPIAPKRKSGDFSFLVGRRVDKNICNFWGELMIREGEVVTREVYLKARTFGKLTELCLHTR